MAFVSAASNLVPGDTNGKPDAFVRDLRSGRTTRVSVGTGGRQSNGTTYDVQIDGACSRVAFTSDATNLHVTKAAAKRNKWLRPVATKAPRAGTKQVYVHFLNGTRDNASMKGATFLASASRRGVPATSDAYDASFGVLGGGCRVGRCGTTSGDSLSFTTSAANLTAGDHNGREDIYQRDFYRPVLRSKQRKSGKKPYLQMKTSLVSPPRRARRATAPPPTRRPTTAAASSSSRRPPRISCRTTTTTPPTSSCAACTST